MSRRREQRGALGKSNTLLLQGLQIMCPTRPSPRACPPTPPPTPAGWQQAPSHPHGAPLSVYQLQAQQQEREAALQRSWRPPPPWGEYVESGGRLH